MKELIKKILPVKTRRKILESLNRFWVCFCSKLPVKNRILFYTIRSNNSLGDNSKALFDALDCKKTVFAHKLPHSNIQKVIAYYKIITSKVIVTDDYCRYMRVVKLREGQKLFQIWHGCGAFKCFALDADTDLTKQQEISVHSQYSAVAVTSEKAKKVFAGAFGIDEEKCLVIGIPSTDYSVNCKDEIRNEILSKYDFLRDKTIYLYCPTFREKDGIRTVFDPQIDWDALSSQLGKNEIFIISKHPHADYNFLNKTYDNIIEFHGESTLRLTAVSDVVITDYSSSVHDAVLLGIPCVFYCPDFDTYERNMYISFPEDLPGEMVTDWHSLLTAVRNAKEKPPEERIEKFRLEQLSACDGHSTQRAAGLIKGWLE